MRQSPPTILAHHPDLSFEKPSTGLLSVVTGGTGFIGSHLVRLLLDRGHRVRVIDIRAPKCLDERVKYFHGTILDSKLVGKVMEGADQVFHLAANPNLWAVDKQEFYELNFLGTRAVLQATRRSDVQRIVHTSTESILKGHHRTMVLRLMKRSCERWTTCRSKFHAEQEALGAARYGLPVVIVNPTLPIGPGDYLMTPPTKMLLDFVNGKNLSYLDFGMNLIDVRDAALGHWRPSAVGLVNDISLVETTFVCRKF